MKRILVKSAIFYLTAFCFFFVLSSVTSVHAYWGGGGLNNLRAEAGPGANQITLNWQRYYSDVTGYSIMYGTEPGKYIYGAANIGNVATYTVGYLQPGVRYYFRLIPYRNFVAVDPTSPEVSEVALSYAKTVIGTAGPYGQRSLTALAGPGSGQVSLTWNSLIPDVSSYNIVYGTAPGSYQYSALNIGKVYKYTINSLTPGTRYYFSVVPIKYDLRVYDSAEVSQVAPR